MKNAGKTMTDLVDFSGPWTEAERIMIMDAAHTVEDARITKARNPHFPPWIVSRHPTPWRDVCVASRFRFSDVLQATTAERLALRIRHFTPEGE